MQLIGGEHLIILEADHDDVWQHVAMGYLTKLGPSQPILRDDDRASRARAIQRVRAVNEDLGHLLSTLDALLAKIGDVSQEDQEAIARIFSRLHPRAERAMNPRW